MTIDERLQFLLRSTESLHSTVQEVVGGLQTLGEKVEALRNTVADLTRVVEIDGEHIRRLANIAAAHQDRLDDLDNRVSG